MYSRENINKIAEIVRRKLDLRMPISYKGLCATIEKLGGRCIPVKPNLIDGDNAEYHMVDNEEIVFEIEYDETCSE